MYLFTYGFAKHPSYFVSVIEWYSLWF